MIHTHSPQQLNWTGSSILEKSSDLSLAAVRVMTGVLLSSVGYGEFAVLSDRPDLIVYSQWSAGLLLIAGLLTPVAGVLGAISLLVSAALYSSPGLLPWLLLTFICLDLALRGGGRYSVDALLKRHFRGPGPTEDLKPRPPSGADSTGPREAPSSSAASINVASLYPLASHLVPDHAAKPSAQKRTYQRAKSAHEIRRRLFGDDIGEHHKDDDAE